MILLDRSKSLDDAGPSGPDGGNRAGEEAQGDRDRGSDQGDAGIVRKLDAHALHGHAESADGDGDEGRQRADGASELQRPDAPFWGQAHDGARRPPPSRLASNKPAAAWDRAGGDLPLLRTQSATAIRLYSGPRRVEASLTGSPMRAAPSAPRAAWLSPRMRRGESRGLFE